VSVRQIRTVARYEVVTMTPKTDKGARTIALDRETTKALRAHQMRQREEQLFFGPGRREAGDLLFTCEDGSPIHPERFSEWFRHHCRDSGLPPIRLHDYADLRVMPTFWRTPYSQGVSVWELSA
jgi:hypothetical protein